MFFAAHTTVRTLALADPVTGIGAFVVGFAFLPGSCLVTAVYHVAKKVDAIGVSMTRDSAVSAN